jgi:hypothetical protein
VPKAGSMTAEEIAKRCEALGARVEYSGSRYRVYPPDPSKRPVFFARKLHVGPEIPNILRTLAQAGLNILAEDKEPAPVPTPADVARKIAPVNGAPMKDQVHKSVHGQQQGSIDELLGLLAEAEKRIDRLQDEVTQLKLDQERTTRNLVERIMRLEDGRPLPPRVTVGQLVREAVLEFLKARPGEKWSPQMIEMNMTDKLPEERGKTAVANACKDLAIEGQLQGGGSNKKGEAQATRGIYWYDPPADDEGE